jgi:hypothetical protein
MITVCGCVCAGIILPILPDKTEDTFGPSDKFEFAFVLKRMTALNVFINKVRWFELSRVYQVF